MRPERSDVNAFRKPSDRIGNLIGRVIGLPGDSVAVEADEVTVNGSKLQREPAESTDQIPMDEFVDAEKFDLHYETLGTKGYLIALTRNHSPSSYEMTTVPPGCLFVLFDNRHELKDSRQFGFVPLGDVYGPV
jgi:signal peptidase I